MKRSLSLVCLLASGLAASALAQSAAAVPNAPSAGGTAAVAPAGPTKVAVIMFQGVVAQTNEGQRNFAEIRKKYEPKQAQLKTQSDEIDNLKKQLQTAGATLSDAERASRLKTIDDKEKSLQRSGEDAQNDFQQEIQQTYAALAEKVFGSVQTYAAANGYTLVVDALGQPRYRHQRRYRGSLQREVRRSGASGRISRALCAISHAASTRHHAYHPPLNTSAPAAERPRYGEASLFTFSWAAQLSCTFRAGYGCGKKCAFLRFKHTKIAGKRGC
jgi:outer membrane protein